MRYADGGGLDARGRACREAVRMQAADLFEQQVPAGQVAWRLRVSVKSAYQWQQTWRRDGRDGLLSKGPSGSRCRLDEARLARLRAELDAGPGRPWVGGGSAVDAATDHSADRSIVSRALHRAGCVVSAAPHRLDAAGAGASGRRTPSATCPGCGSVSGRVHSRYGRRLSDSAVSGRELLIHIRVRRFFCRNGGCGKKTVAEPLPQLAVRYGRRTELARRLLASVGLALGGRAGTRLADALALPVNRMTLIRTIRRIPDPVVDTPSVLGVDLSRLRGYPDTAVDPVVNGPVGVGCGDWATAPTVGIIACCRTRCPRPGWSLR